MPLIDSEYRCSPAYRNGHIQTLYPRLARKRASLRPAAGTLATPDGDELELFSHCPRGQGSLVIITHGLESHGKEGAVLELAETVSRQGYDALSWSMRSCGKQVNKTRWFYNGRDYADLKALIDHYSGRYDSIYLFSFSLGGTITANYLGRDPGQCHPAVKGAFLLSPPLELHSFHRAMRSPLNHYLYQRHFVRSLLNKFHQKTAFIDYSDSVDVARVKRARTVDEIEDRLFAPMHGYDSSVHYRDAASALPTMKNVRVPVYILAAEDDPFIDSAHLPIDLARDSEHLYLELSRHGGHTGYIKRKNDAMRWYERRFFWFLERIGSAHLQPGAEPPQTRPTSSQSDKGSSA